MTLSLRHLQLHVMRPTLARVGLHSVAAEKLLLGTVAHESTVAGVTMLDQVTGPGDLNLGPAIGIYQIEPDTMRDVFANFLEYRPELRLKVVEHLATVPDPLVQLASNLCFATCIARLIYYRRPEALPYHDDTEALADYWKRFYNTEAGSGTTAAWLLHYREHVAPLFASNERK